MARRLDRILVVDVESTCWEDEPLAGQMSEIIEIGLCVVDVAALERVERRSILVRPACSTVSAYCTQLTTLTQADVDAGVPLTEACRVLADEYRSRERPFASFGDYDR
jgi:inhibitor of KinA sporulation pathway (predicted exonuclease)